MDVPTGTASNDIAEQTRKAIENLMGTLQTVGLSLDDVVKTTVYLTDMGDFPGFNTAYAQYFNQAPLPVRTTVGVAELPRVADRSLRVEIEVIAVRASPIVHVI